MNILNGRLKPSAKEVVTYLKTFVKWVLVALFLGIVCGGVGSAFHLCLEKSNELFLNYDWILYLLPVAGLAIAGIYKLAKMDNKSGTDIVIEASRTDTRPPFLMAPSIFVGTVLTHLCGGSAGREGAALQMGGTFGAIVAKILKFDEKSKRIVLMCGMSAMFSSIFGAPITAAVFSMEIVSVGVVYYAAIVPCIISSLSAFFIAGLLGISPISFGSPEIPDFSALTALSVLGLSVAGAVLSIVFCVVMHKTTHLYKKLIPNTFLRVAAGGVIVVLLTLLVGTRDYNGAGISVIERALTSTVGWEAFLLKLVFTAITLGAGYKGGEIVPSFFIGATFGNTFSRVVRLNPQFGGALGLICVFCGATNAPLTSIILSVELFGSKGLIYFALTCAVSYLLSGPFSLYSGQKIAYSKLKPSYVDEDTK